MLLVNPQDVRISVYRTRSALLLRTFLLINIFGGFESTLNVSTGKKGIINIACNMPLNLSRLRYAFKRKYVMMGFYENNIFQTI